MVLSPMWGDTPLCRCCPLPTRPVLFHTPGLGLCRELMPLPQLPTAILSDLASPWTLSVFLLAFWGMSAR